MTPARLRIWILRSSRRGLVAAIAAFFVYGRWQGHRLGRDLPDGIGNLHAAIHRRVYSFGVARTAAPLYTLHASKAVPLKSDGHAKLHGVSITLYGAQEPPANRIYGSDFDWDPVHGVAPTMGEVQIDFREGETGRKTAKARRRKVKTRIRYT